MPDEQEPAAANALEGRGYDAGTMQPIALLVTVGVCWGASSGLCAQSVLRVPGQFPTPSAAIAAARPGDTVILDTQGPHPSFALGKGITLVAGPAGAEIFDFGSPVSTVQVPPGERAVLEGITFSTALGQFGSALRIAGGDVHCRRCTFSFPGFGPASAACEVLGGAAAFEGCQFEAAYPAFALSTVGCTVSLTGCSLRARLSGFGLPSQLAVEIGTGTVAQFDACSVRGAGASSYLAPWGAPAMSVRASTVWISDSVLVGGDGLAGNAAGGGASAIVVVAGSRVTEDGTTFTAGTGSSVPPSIQGTVRSAPVLRATAVPAPVAGTAWAVSVAGAPASLVAMVGADAAGAVRNPVLEQPWWLGTGNLDVLGWAVLDGSGRGAISVALPSVLPAGLTLLQLFGTAVGPLQASPLFSVRT